MNSRINFLLGLSLLAVAGALAVSITTRPGPAEEKRTAAADSSGPSLAPLAGNAPNSRSGPDSTGSAAASLQRLGLVVDPSHPEHRELAERARRVDGHAREQLARLTRDLDLSLDQQRRIYPKLVTASDSYHPAMRIVGTGVAVDPGPLDADLDPLQRDQLVDRELEDLILWQAIIAKLESDLEMRTRLPGPQPVPAADPVPAGQAPPAEEPPSGGGRNLFDVVPPAR